jgi:Coenzyme PQQ synthesis protein D (PqqD)
MTWRKMGDNGAADRYHLAGPEIISESFDDGESVVVNLDNGCYFSLNPVGGWMFDLLASGVSVDAVTETVGGRYDAAPDAIRAAVAEFAVRLLDEALLAPGAPEADVTETGGREAQPREWSDEPVTFEAPRLTAYTDMQDLLLADPIHDYDETGWPARVDER